MRVVVPNLLKSAAVPIALLPFGEGLVTGTPHVHEMKPPTRAEQITFAPAGDIATATEKLLKPEPARVSASEQGSVRLRMPIKEENLSRAEEKRFLNLAALYALDKITVSEMQEFRTLDHRRTLTQPALPSHVIEQRERLLSKMDDLIEELSTFGKRRDRRS